MLKIKRSRSVLEQVARNAIENALRNIRGADLKFEPNTPSPFDFEIIVKTGWGCDRLFCEVKSRAWQNELYGIVQRLRQAVESFGEGVVPVLIAPVISSEAAAVCRQFDISWVDLGGNCEIELRQGFLKIAGQASAKTTRTSEGSLFSPQASRVIHALLLDPNRKWTLRELADSAGVSIGKVSEVKKILTRNDWVESSYGRTVLSQPRKLLDGWASHYAPNRTAHHCFSLEAPHVFESSLAQALPDAVLTEFSAAERYAPYTRYQTVAFYVEEWSEERRHLLNLRAAESGPNVIAYETGSPILFSEVRDGAVCASPIQTYLDLLQNRGRAQGAAEYLLEQAILPRWRHDA